MKLFKDSIVSKKYALKAARYRRVAKTHNKNLDFCYEALLAQFNYESKGIGRVDKHTNGYTYGKWLVDLSVSMMFEDINRGDFCKYDFLRTSIDRIHNKKVLELFIPTNTYFPYSK